jgi:hypothetical protein
MLVKVAILFAAPMQRNPACVRVLVRPVRILHVGAHFRDEHSSVSIECDGDRLFDLGFSHDFLDAIPVCELKAFDCLLDACSFQRRHG